MFSKAVGEMGNLSDLFDQVKSKYCLLQVLWWFPHLGFLSALSHFVLHFLSVVTQRRCKQVHQLKINCVQGDSMSFSCLTTTHSLESLTVKLHKSNQDKDILMYPDISPASEHQRWSVRKDAANVTLDLKYIRLSDDGFYDCQVYKDQDCLHATRFNLSIISENVYFKQANNHHWGAIYI